MDAHDFVDTTKDAGEVGAGHSVTALYEVKLADTEGTFDGITLEFASEHKDIPEQMQSNNTSRKELCKLSVAYKEPETENNVTLSTLFGMEKYSEEPSHSLRLAGAAAEFAMLLKNSQYKGNSSYSMLLNTVEELDSENEKIEELYSLIKTASTLYE